MLHIYIRTGDISFYIVLETVMHVHHLSWPLHSATLHHRGLRVCVCAEAGMQKGADEIALCECLAVFSRRGLRMHLSLRDLVRSGALEAATWTWLPAPAAWCA